MKIYQIIGCIIINITFTSCFQENYRMITRVERNGSCQAEIHGESDTLISPESYSPGWKIAQTDTIVEEYLSPKNKNNFKLSKKFKSVEELSADATRQQFCPTPDESLKKRFRWFYTYYTFTAVFPEVTAKGRVPMDLYLNKEEQKFYFQGDMSAYHGMTGYEMKMELDEIESRFMKWYARSVYEESFDIILQYAVADFRSELPVIKDSLYAIREKLIMEDCNTMFQEPQIVDICMWLDNFFDTNRFAEQYATVGEKMEEMLREKRNVIDELFKFEIQYELILPGRLVSANANLQNEGYVSWNISMFKFLADDYVLTAESRTANIWTFAVTLLLVLFTVYCFRKYK
jgi:hypothetical protein